MALPLLGLLAAGMLGSGGMTWLSGKLKDSRRSSLMDDRSEQLNQIIGAPGMEQAGPRREQYQGQQLMSEGTGLMANPQDPANQIRAGVGLMGAGFESAGNSLLNQATAAPTVAKPSSFAEKLSLMGYRPGTQEYTKAARELAMRPSTQIDMNSSKLVTASDAERIRLKDGSTPPPGTRYSDLPGMGAQFITKRTPEQSGKIAQMRGAQEQIPLISSFMFNEDGSVNRKNIVNAQLGIPGTDGQTLGTAYEAGIQAITRSETGAAMPPEEVNNTRKRFEPKITDTDLTIRLKWDMYQDFLNGSIKLIDSGGIGDSPKFDSKAFDAELKRRIKKEKTPDGNSKVIDWNDL